MTIVIVDSFGSPTIRGDLSVFDSQPGTRRGFSAWPVHGLAVVVGTVNGVKFVPGLARLAG
jgi:hypothetical protein